MASGLSMDTVFQETRPGAGFETGDSVKEQLGGYGRKTQPSFESRSTVAPPTFL